MMLARATCAAALIALALALALGCGTPAPSVVLNELTSSGSDSIELYNRSDRAVDLAGWTLTDLTPERPGHRFTFPAGSTIEAGAHVVLVRGLQHAFKLGDDGGVVLIDDDGLVVDRVEYGAGAAVVSFCRIPDGDGFFESCPVATFGVDNVEGCGSPTGRAVLNEVRSSDGGIELFNPTDAPADLSGWRVTDESPDSPGHRFVLPEGSIVEPSGFLALRQGEDHLFSPGLADSIRLEAPNGCLVDEARYAPGDAELSYCRFPDGAGAFQACPRASLGAPNVGLCADAGDAGDAGGAGGAGDVVLNEVSSTGEEEIEIFNRSDVAVDLAGASLTDAAPEVARLRFVFPAGAVIAPQSFLVLTAAEHGLSLGADDAVYLELGETCVADLADYGQEEAALSYCRVPDGTGPFQPCANPTFGQANAP